MLTHLLPVKRGASLLCSSHLRTWAPFKLAPLVVHSDEQRSVKVEGTGARDERQVYTLVAT